MVDLINRFYGALSKNGWMISCQNIHPCSLPPCVSGRYQNIDHLSGILLDDLVPLDTAQHSGEHCHVLLYRALPDELILIAKSNQFLFPLTQLRNGISQIFKMEVPEYRLLQWTLGWRSTLAFAIIIFEKKNTCPRCTPCFAFPMRAQDFPRKNSLS